MEPLLSWPTEETPALTRADVVQWWEARRLRFNLYVGSVGVATWLLVLFAGSAAVKPGVDFVEPLAMIFGPFFYGIMANVCYTMGWLVDCLAFKGAPRIGLYMKGVFFSVVITALPGLWALAAWLITIITGQKLN